MSKKIKSKTVVIKVNETTINKMKDFYQDFMRLKTPLYAIFQADCNETIITVYESGKAMFQGISADLEASLWGKSEVDDIKKEEKPDKDDNIYYVNSIGSDEVGTGDYFGPIIVTGALVTKSDIKFLEDLGIKDSKVLTDEFIMNTVPQLINKIPYYSVKLSNSEYNEKYGTTMNMNKIKAVLHNKVLKFLTNEHKDNYDMVIVDQFTTPKSYFNYLKDTNSFKDITFVTKAESKNLSVAVASMISRYLFIKEIDKLSKEININLPKGAGSLVDEIGKEVIKQYDEKKLFEIAKLNFKNTQRILKID